MKFELKDKVVTLCERDGIAKGSKGEVIQASAFPTENYMVQFNDEFGALIGNLLRSRT